MSDLRDHLFETLESLKDEEKPMDLERACAIRGIATAIIESAKVEVSFMRASDERVSGGSFFEVLELRDPASPRLVTSEPEGSKDIVKKLGR